MYLPDPLILEKYAALLVKFALHGGKGVQSGEVVECIFPENAKPLAREIHKQLLLAQAHPVMRMQPDGFEEDFYRYGQKSHWEFFPENYYQAKANLISHHIYISDPTQSVLTNQELQHRQLRRSFLTPFEEWLDAKEASGSYSWTMAIWPTEKTAGLVEMSLEAYWQELIQACQLNTDNPIAAWQATNRQLHQIRDELNSLHIKKMHITGEDIDLQLELEPTTQWLGGRGKNIPSYEVFTTPNFKSVNGWFKSNQVLARSGAVIVHPQFHFVDGYLQKCTAESGQESLATLLEIEGMKHVGEISLTDKKLSKITKRLGVTLLDENMGGEFGNFHLALGDSFKDAYHGQVKPATKEEWLTLGYNSCSSHIDFVSTSDREVRVITQSGEELWLYKNGEFLLEG